MDNGYTLHSTSPRPSNCLLIFWTGNVTQCSVFYSLLQKLSSSTLKVKYWGVFKSVSNRSCLDNYHPIGPKQSLLVSRFTSGLSFCENPFPLTFSILENSRPQQIYLPRKWLDLVNLFRASLLWCIRRRGRALCFTNVFSLHSCSDKK